MPNRILREGILSSPRITRLGWAEEVFYRRLMSVVDDFGRFYADHGLLRAACYPRQLGKVSDPDIGKWLTVLVEAALVRVYPAEDGERYLELEKFGQQVRAKKSRFPNPRSACLANAEHVYSDCAADARLDVFVSEDVIVDVDEGVPPARKRAPPPAKPPDVADQTWADWLQLRKAKRAPVTQTVVDGARSESLKAGMTLDAFLRVWCSRGSQGLEAAWLKPQERGNGHADPQWRTEQKTRNAAYLGPAMAGATTTFEEPENATTKRLG